MDSEESISEKLLDGTFALRMERQQCSPPSVIVIGGGISGVAAARILYNASFKVLLLESRDRLGGRIHTDYSFGCPVDMGASWLHGVCNENPLAPLIRCLGLTLYRTSGDNSVLYDHDLESYKLFDKDGGKSKTQPPGSLGMILKHPNWKDVLLMIMGSVELRCRWSLQSYSSSQFPKVNMPPIELIIPKSLEELGVASPQVLQLESLPIDSEAIRLLGPTWGFSFAIRALSSASLFLFCSRYVFASADVRHPTALASLSSCILFSVQCEANPHAPPWNEKA